MATTDADRFSTTHRPYQAAFLVVIVAISLVWPLALVPAAGLLIVLMASPYAAQLMLAYGALLFGASVALSDVPLSVGFFKLYGADLFIIFVGWGMLARALKREASLNVTEQRFVMLLAGICAYGLFSAFIGFRHGHPYDEVLGWYRRLFFYMIPFVIPLWIPLQRRHLQSFKYMIFFGGLLVLALATYRIAAGQPLKQEIDWSVGHVSYRMISVSEYCVLSMFLAYSIVVLRLRSDLIGRALALSLAGLAAVLLLLSGYRLGMALAIGTPVLTLGLVFWIRGGGARSFLHASLATGVAAIPAIFLLTFFFSEQFGKAIFDLEVRFQELRVVGDYRVWIWSEVFQQARDRPLFGAGLGHDFTFLNRTRSGMFEIKSASTHSTVMSLLNQTGMIGMALYGVFHLAFVVYVIRNIRRIPSALHGVSIALISAYIVTMVASNLEPLRVGGYVALYFTMGLVVRILREHDTEWSANQPPMTES